jgi:hypothetical protein
MKLSSLLLSLSCIIAPMSVHSNTWNPDPPLPIPGAIAGVSAARISSSYSPTLAEFLTTWVESVGDFPVYALFNGSSWTTPAHIPGSSTAVPAGVFSSFGLGIFVSTWLNNSPAIATYATFNGSSWTTPAQIGATATAVGPINPAFDSLAGTFLATWINSVTNLPTYSIFNGVSWSTPTAIPGSSTALANGAFLSFDAVSGKFLVVWKDQSTGFPFYALFDGTNWTTPVAIPGAGATSDGAVIVASDDALAGLFLITWKDATSSLPFYATFNGTSWSTPASVPGSGTCVEAVTSSFDSSSGVFMVMWIDNATRLPFYATYTGVTWSTPSGIPSSTVQGQFNVFSAAAPDSFLATFAEMTVLTPFYSVFQPSLPPPPPVSITGLASQNRSVLQKELLNIISWTAPVGVPWTPAFYLLYRNAALTDLAGSVPATGPLEFVDHNRQSGTLYTYYLVAVDTLNVHHFLGSVTVRSE